ncbi:MAG: hypothetical protein CFK49_05590 [Armatimonadetes bacterium JP3_11]|nr:MAG: hypothetical protein CFK48_07030 [Armatimonadetes bacterium CP1_7O]OYT74990.1 MAG: hypothetical protein CFK49_05590 [Armatimonadetes bacterium JP3_11]
MRYLWIAATLVGMIGGAGQTAIQVRPLIHEDALSYRGAYQVELIQQQGTASGALIAADQQGHQWVYPLDLTASARKRLYLSLDVAHRYAPRWTAPRLEWRDAESKVQRIEAPTLLPLHLPIVVVGNLKGGLEFLNDQQVAFLSTRLRLSEANVPMQVYYWRPSDLPDDWRALLEVPILVLTEGAETLNDAQLRALRLWLNAGGTLVLNLGAFSSWRATPFASLITAEPDGLFAPFMPDMPQLGLFWRRVGQGMLLLFSGDVGSARWRARPELRTMFQAIASSSRLPSELLTQRVEAGTERFVGVMPYERLDGGIGVLALYGLGVWVLSAQLRRQRRLATVFKPLIGLTALTCVAVWLLAPRLPQSKPIVNRVVLQSAILPTVEVGTLRTHLPAGHHQITLPEDALVVSIQVQPFTPLIIRDAAAPQLELHCKSHTRVAIGFVCPVEQPPRVQLKRLGQFATLRNLTNEPLRSLQLYNDWFLIGESAPLQHLESLLPRQEARFRVSETLSAWLRTPLPPSDASVFIAGKPVQEVRSLWISIP